MSRTNGDQYQARSERFDNEDKILEVIREHLREARRNSAVGKLVFDLDINRGGIARFWVDVVVRYRFMQNQSAVASPSAQEREIG